MGNVKRICSVEGCDRIHRANGLCHAHNERRRMGQDMNLPLRQYERGPARICKVEDCSRRRTTHGTYCPMHYRRLVRHGDAGVAEPERAEFGDAVWSTLEYRRNYRRRVNYGLSPAEHDRMLADQNRRCAICWTDDPKTARVDTWIVDHNHITGQVRGLLCSPCNRALGMFQDNPDVLAAAIAYLMKARSAETA